jgi:hypothetical protein
MKDVRGAEGMAVVEGMKTGVKDTKNMVEDKKNGIRNEGKKEDQERCVVARGYS